MVTKQQDAGVRRAGASVTIRSSVASVGVRMSSDLGSFLIPSVTWSVGKPALQQGRICAATYIECQTVSVLRQDRLGRELQGSLGTGSGVHPPRSAIVLHRGICRSSLKHPALRCGRKDSKLVLLPPQRPRTIRDQLQ